MDWLFQKDPTELRIDDLREKLSDVPEGFYTEYKGPDTITHKADIAKAIAALANTRGGWLFIGLDTDDDNKPLLQNPPGVSRDDAGTERIQQIASGLSPGPHLACARIPVSEDEASNVILGIYVEESDDPPLVRRSDGKIYVREGNVSRPIKDKAELDRLYDKSLRNAEKVQDLLARHREGAWLVEKQYSRYRAPESRKSGFRPRAPKGYAYGLCYPMSASFQISGLFASRNQPVEVLSTASLSLANLLNDEYKGFRPSFPDQYTVQYIAESGFEGIQADVHGHFAYSKLTETNPDKYQLDPALPRLLSICWELYKALNYWGRVGLIVCMGRLLKDEEWKLPKITLDARLERLLPAAEIANINIEELQKEADRALGKWDA